MGIKKKLCNRAWFSDFVRKIVLFGSGKLNFEVYKMVHPVEGKKILDVACGTHTFSDWIYGNYTGVDTNQDILEVNVDKYPRKVFKVMDARKLKFKKNSFDIVLVMNLLHHLNDEDAIKVLKEAKRVAKEKIVVIDNVIPCSFIKGFFMLMDEGKFIRTELEEQRLVEDFLDITDMEEFSSGFFDFVAIQGSPKK